MQNFDFRTVPYLINECGASKQLGSIIRVHFPAANRILLITDNGMLSTGLVEPVIQNLRSHQLQVSVYSKVVADPPEAVVAEAVNFARDEKAQLVLGLGGGSAMDVAKLVAILYNGNQPLSDMYGVGKVHTTRLPLVQIPTTAGTGSEVTPIAIVTTGATTKMGVVAPQLYADIAVLDAELTIGLPSHVSAATGIDAMVHAIEAYTTRHKKNPLSDMLAKEALSLLWNNIRIVCREPSNLPARQAMLLGACLAGQAFANAPCAAVHALAYPIGGIFHVPHGLSNSLVLAPVLRFNAAVAHHHYAELASIIVPQELGSDEAKTAAFIQALENLAPELGIATRLHQVGVSESDLDQLANDAMLQTRLLSNNPREMSLHDARDIYAQAL